MILQFMCWVKEHGNGHQNQMGWIDGLLQQNLS